MPDPEKEAKPVTDNRSPAFGPGSQPTEEDGAELDFIPMPSDMMTYSMPEVPEAEEVAGLGPAMAILEALHAALFAQKSGPVPQTLDLAGLDSENLGLIDQVLGEGEVSIIAGAGLQVQEAVLTGVWRLRSLTPEGAIERDLIEIGTFPAGVLAMAFEDAQAAPAVGTEALPEGVVNAPSVLVELADKAQGHRHGATPHVVNLTLLPQTEDDLAFLESTLGRGPVTILSRGYGNCRITATALSKVWWVQYFNSQDAMILNTIEVCDVPSVACAAPEDLADSAARLEEILEVYR